MAQKTANALRIRFALGFVFIAAALFLIYTYPYPENGIVEAWFTSYLSAYARLAGHVLRPFDAAVLVNGQDIVGRYSLRIVKNCDAMEANILYTAAVLAFPLAWNKRLIGVCVGIPLLIFVNVLRICTLYFIGIRFPGEFEFFHLELWPLLIIGSAVATFFAWVTWAERDELGRTTPVVS